MNFLEERDRTETDKVLLAHVLGSSRAISSVTAMNTGNYRSAEVVKKGNSSWQVKDIRIIISETIFSENISY